MIKLLADENVGGRVGHIHSGILFYRLPRTTTEEKGQIILRTLREYEDKLIDAFTVVTTKKVRIRKL